MKIRKIKKLIHLTFCKNRFKTPPILIFFVTSACNSNCPHCFYKDNLNRKNDLSLAEIEKISRSAGKVYQLLLSGGEPFLRKDLAEICELFYKNNHLEELQIPTNSLLTDKIHPEVEVILRKCPGVELSLNLSLDGTEKIHDSMRGVKGNFKKVVKNYQNLAILQKTHKNLLINVVSTVTRKNLDDLSVLIDDVAQKMPQVGHHYLGYERRRFYTDEVSLPETDKLIKLNKKIERLYRKKDNFINVNLLKKIKRIKIETLVKKRQVVPCLAGRLAGVVYEDGKIANCEMLPPTGRVRAGNFQKAWQETARINQQREIVEKNICHCTHECFLGPSVVYQSLLKTLKSGLQEFNGFSGGKSSTIDILE